MRERRSEDSKPDNKAKHPESVPPSLVGGAAMTVPEEPGCKGKQGKRKIRYVQAVTVGRALSYVFCMRQYLI